MTPWKTPSEADNAVCENATIPEPPKNATVPGDR